MGFLRCLNWVDEVKQLPFTVCKFLTEGSIRFSEQLWITPAIEKMRDMKIGVRAQIHYHYVYEHTLSAKMRRWEDSNSTAVAFVCMQELRRCTLRFPSTSWNCSPILNICMLLICLSIFSIKTTLSGFQYAKSKIPWSFRRRRNFLVFLFAVPAK